MNDTLKAAKLDFAMVRPYMKTICVTMLMPVVFAAINRSLISGVSFAVCFMAMTAGYPFSISEKTGMDRMYGILPISKKNLVLGRYLYTSSMGLLAFLLSMTALPLALKMLGETVQSLEICLSAILGIFMFTIYTVFQLPGYYRFGYIKGRIFMYIPVAGYLAILLVFVKFDAMSNQVITKLMDNPTITVIGILLVCIMAYLLSIAISIKIMQSREI